ARIAFDLDAPMGESTCVTCGECMVSCPTGALVNRTVVRPEWKAAPAAEDVPAEELAQHWLFQGVSAGFLSFNAGAVVRRRYKKGEVICRERDSGNTAFLIEKGRVTVSIQAPMSHVEARKG